MAYEDSSNPFDAFITNLGKYNEGELIGEWVKFPTTPENMQEVMKRIGIGSKDDFGHPYEEYFITDYNSNVDGLTEHFGEYESLDELNYLANKISEMDRSDYDRFEAAIEYGDYTGSVKDLINLTENLDCYELIEGIHDEADLGRYYIEESGAYDTAAMGNLSNYIDYEAFGRDVALEESGQFLSAGYVVDGRDTFTEVYDGSREEIPGEYKLSIVTEQHDDIGRLAYDLDRYSEDTDPYEYRDVVDDPEVNINEVDKMLRTGDTEYLKNWLDGIIKDGSDDDGKAQELLDRINKLCPEKATLSFYFAECMEFTNMGECHENLTLQQAVDYYNKIPGERLNGGKGIGFNLKDGSDYTDTNYGVMFNGTIDVDGVNMIDHFKNSALVQKAVQDIKDAFPDAKVLDASAKQQQEETMKVLIIEPEKKPRIADIDTSLETMKNIVGGSIECTYPYVDEVGLICNEEGKINGLPLNRAIYDENGNMTDIIAGTFIIAGLTEDDFGSLTAEQLKTFSQKFARPEIFTKINGEIKAVPIIQEDAHLKNAEVQEEDDYGMIDGILNNGPKEEKGPATEKASIKEQLSEAKKECEKQDKPEKDKGHKPPDHNNL